MHGNSGTSSQEIQAFNIVNNDFNKMEGSGTYGSARGYGPNVTLATDGSAFYYGRLQVDPLDVTHNLRVFPEAIYAATGDVAFGNGKFYDAHTGELLGSLGFNTTVYGLNPVYKDFWAYDQSQNKLRHFSPIPDGLPDLTPPSVPAGLAASAISSSQIDLSWNASIDDVGVTDYKIYRDGVQVGTPTGTSFSDTGLSASTLYSYTVVACDAASNCSNQSSPASVTTQAANASSNVALASAGGVASASSTINSNYPVSALIDNLRSGAGLTSGAWNGWNDGTKSVYPDWVQIDFNGSKTIDHVVVYTVQDNYSSSAEPSDTTTFSLYGVVDFTVQGWNGSAWVTLGTVTGNNLVKRTVNFAAYTTDRIRINVTGCAGELLAADRGRGMGR